VPDHARQWDAGALPGDGLPFLLASRWLAFRTEGNRPYKAEREYLYRGISARPFKRQFSLADYVKVKNAAFENGLLKLEAVGGKSPRR
jgi:hypothetical protein